MDPGEVKVAKELGCSALHGRVLRIHILDAMG
jgi:hypothetical protein